jgi:HAMP domain-containing protein
VNIWSAARIAALDLFGFLDGAATTGRIHQQLCEFDNHKKRIQSGDSRRTPKIQKIHSLGALEGNEFH